MNYRFAFLLLISFGITPLCMGQEADAPSADGRIDDFLKKPCRFDFASASIDELADALRSQFDVNVVVDRAAIAQAGIDECQLTGRVDGIACRSALLLMLEPHDLTFAIRWDSIVLTTQAQADEYWRTVVYDVTDLVSGHRRAATTSLGGQTALQNTASVDFDSLIHSVLVFVQPDTWSAGTGPSQDCHGMTVGPRHLLIVKQSERGHMEIENLFSGIHRAVPKHDRTTRSRDGPAAATR